jgi:hypothetical protein
MDINILYQYTQTKDYTDALLVINDTKTVIEMNIHKNILASQSSYFHKLFTFGNNLGKAMYEIRVNNAIVFYDVVNMMYGQVDKSKMSNIRYLFEIVKCQDYLCLPNDSSMLYDLVVMPDDFDIFIELAQKFDVMTNNSLKKAIRRNMPPDYDTTILPIDLVKELSHIDFKITTVIGSHIKIWDGNTGNIQLTINFPDEMSEYEYPTIAKFSRDNSKIIFVYYNKLYLCSATLHGTVDIKHKAIQKIMHFFDTIKDISISPDNQKFAVIIRDFRDTYQLEIHDMIDNKPIFVKNGHKMHHIEFLTNDKILITDNNGIEIWDINQDILIASFEIKNIKRLSFTSDFQKVIIATNRSIVTIDVSNNSLSTLYEMKYDLSDENFARNPIIFIENSCVVKWSSYCLSVYDELTDSIGYISCHANSMADAIISHHDQRIITVHSNGYIKMWDSSNGKLIWSSEIPIKDKVTYLAVSHQWPDCINNTI